MKEIQQIPGYYYDPEKKKYFKIQPSSSATSSYSIQDVKRRKTRDEHNVAEVAAIASQKGRIRRPALLRRPLSGAFLARETYQRQNRDRLPTPEILASGYTPSTNSLDMNFNPLFAITPRQDIGSSSVNLLTTNDGNLQHFLLDTTTCRMEQLAAYRFPGSALSTSISVNTDIQQVAITWHSDRPSSGIAVTSMSDNPDGQDNRPRIMVMGAGDSRGYTDINASTTAHSSSTLSFAFGTSNGILTMKKLDAELSWLTPKPTRQKRHDIQALESCPVNPFILFSGDRNGILGIWDIRVPNSESATDAIHHPSSIIHIKPLDMYRTVVAGLNSSLRQYDLRYQKLRFFATKPSLNSTKFFRNKAFTQPILEYPEYRNDSRIHIGFDVDTESGIIATAQERDDVHPTIQLFSLHGGHVLSSPSLQRWTSNNLPNEGTTTVRCVKFVRDTENRPKSLWLSARFRDGFGLKQFTWGDLELGDVEG